MSKLLKFWIIPKKNNIFAGIHNGTPEYALKMIDIGFNIVTVGADQLFIKNEGLNLINKLKGKQKNETKSKSY